MDNGTKLFTATCLKYYPFGLQTQNSWTRDNTTNNFLYNRGTELNNTTGVYDTPFRGYDPTLGRFMQIDPLSLYSHTMTPYHYAANNPISYNDPTGLKVALTIYDIINYLWNNTDYGGTWTNDGGGGGDGTFNAYGSQDEAFNGTVSYLNANGGWGGTAYGSEEVSRQVYQAIKQAASSGARQLVSTGLYHSDGTGMVGILGGQYLFFQVDANGNTYVPYTNELFNTSGNLKFASSQNYSSPNDPLFSEDGSGNSDANPLYTAIGGVTSVTGLAVDITKSEIKSGAVYATQAGAKGVKLLGRGATGVSLLVSGFQFIYSDGKPSDYARLTGSVLITASVAIPYGGPVISFGLGTADAAGAFENFYKSWDIPGMPIVYLNMAVNYLPK